MPGRRLLHAAVFAASLAPLVLLPTACTLRYAISADEVARMDRVVGPGAEVAYRGVSREAALAVYRDAAALRAALCDVLGVEPVAVEAIVTPGWYPSRKFKLTVNATVDRANGRVRFFFPIPGDDVYAADAARGVLRHVLAHELAEGTILLKLGDFKAQDPHARWLYDGAAELASYRAIARVDRSASLPALEEQRAQVAAAVDAGADAVDLTRWRQSAPVVRLDLDSGATAVPLDDGPQAIRALGALRADASERDRALLDELLAAVAVAWAERMRPAPDGVLDLSRGDGQAGYAVSFAFWLRLERAREDLLRAFGARVRERSGREMDPLLRGEEALALLSALSGRDASREARRFDLRDGLAAIDEEAARCSREPRDAPEGRIRELDGSAESPGRGR